LAERRGQGFDLAQIHSRSNMRCDRMFCNTGSGRGTSDD
jgi:hypothetical protein